MYLILLLCWLIFNGKFTWEICILGLALSALCYGFVYKFLNWSVKKEIALYRFIGFLISYLFLLIVEIVKATVATIGIAFDEEVELRPVVVTFTTDIQNVVLRVLLANSITMTPGTITATLENGVFKVHALDESFAVDIDKSVFVEKIMRADKLLSVLTEEKNG